MTKKVLKAGDEIKLEEYHRRKWLEYEKLIGITDILHRDYLDYLERAKKAEVEFWASVRRNEKVAVGCTLKIDRMNRIVKIVKIKEKKEV